MMEQHTYKSDNWFVCPQANPRADIRLFIFPYAGGGPAAFNKWSSAFPERVEAWIAHYPGRGSRFQEPALTSVNTLTEQLSQVIRVLLNKPFAFFGHSFGGLVAFELAKSLQRRTLLQPQILFVSGCGAPHLSDPHPPMHGYSDSAFIKSLQEMNGVPSDVLNHPELLQLLLPALRADFEAFETYAHVPEDAPLHCPIVAFGGMHDPRLSRERVEAWAQHTDSGFESHYFPGDHFFINTARDLAIDAMVAELLSTYAKH